MKRYNSVIWCVMVLVAGGLLGRPCEAGDEPVTQKAPASAPAKPKAGVATPKLAADRKYVPVTAEEIQLHARLAKQFTEAVQEKLGVKLAVAETAHFTIYTNWDPREMAFLKKNVEEAYGVISRQFDVPVKENIFVGKLPVYMLAKESEFAAFSEAFTKMGRPDGPGKVMGFHATRTLTSSEGETFDFSFMCMWKPVLPPRANFRYALENPEVLWAYTLAHEMTHAFVHRYRSNQRIPRWLNEGIAEVVASTAVPDPMAIGRAKEFARKNDSIAHLFADDKMPSGEMYPVMRTVVETMVAADRKGFLSLFGDLKDGGTMEDALKKYYKTDFAGLEAAWRKYLGTR